MKINKVNYIIPPFLLVNQNHHHSALTAISCLYLGLPNDILPALTQLDAAEHVPGNIEDIGLDYMVSAARHGDVNSMVYLAKAFDSGLNLGTDRSQSYTQAVDWYQRAVSAGVEKRYVFMARVAEIMLMDDSGIDTFSWLRSV